MLKADSEVLNRESERDRGSQGERVRKREPPKHIWMLYTIKYCSE